MKIATYGSLKRRGYNHGRMGPQHFIGEAVVEGYQLYTSPACPYPCVVPDPAAKVAVEIFEVTDGAYERLRWMEEGAGYHMANVVTPVGEATLWFMLAPPDGWVKGGVSW